MLSPKLNKEKDRRKLECNARICESTSTLGHVNVVRVVPRCVVKRQFGDRITDYVQLTNVGHAHARLSEHMSAFPGVTVNGCRSACAHNDGKRRIALRRSNA